ncbi:MAG: type II secretion system protein [Planctomycetota bacterium]|jgi:prepilin-type N-terminal cleavage/methylation domain-containing protein
MREVFMYKPAKKNELCIKYKKNRNTFTLVELLVVIAIISILAGMLLPSLENALGTARLIDCANRMKQIGLATMLYVQDADGTLPPATGSGPEWPKVLSGGSESYYKNYLPMTTSWDGPFMCQTYAQGDNPKAQNSSAANLKVSYTYNMACGWYHVSYPQYRTLKIQSVTSVSEKAYLIDGFYRSSTKTWYAIRGADMFSGANSPMNRHVGGFNSILYLDGHTGKMTEEEILLYKDEFWNLP